jgi:hypothetical protein
MDTLGACAHSVDLASGELRWGFISDLCSQTHEFCLDPDNPGQAEYIDAVLGEQYVDMISGWWQTTPPAVIGIRAAAVKMMSTNILNALKKLR